MPEQQEASIFTKVIEHGTISRSQIIVFVSGILLNMLDGFDVMAMAFTADPIGKELGIPADQLGLVFSSALAGMMVGAMFVAPLSDRWGRRPMILLCTAILSLTTLLTGLSTTLWALLPLRFLTGITVGCLLASLAAFVSEYSPSKYRSLAVVSVTAGYPLGAMMGGFIADYLIPLHGWESVFYAGSVLTAVMAFLLYGALPESLQFLLSKRPDNALQRVNAVLERLNQSSLTELPEQQKQTAKTKASVWSLLDGIHRQKTLILWSSFFFCFTCLYFLLSWIPKLVIEAGLSLSEGIYASMAFNGGGVVGIFLLGWFAAQFGLSRLIGTSLLASVVGMLLFAVASGIDHLIVYLLLIGVLLQAGFTGLYAVAANIYPTEIRATGVGWAIGLGRFGAVVGPYIGGVLIDQQLSMESSFVIFAIPLLVSGLLAYRLRVA
ncbi:MAG: MFS transporter [Bacteroidota bacterium]